ncbi:ADP ribosylation factor like GTPase 3, like 1 isoform 1-T1 [Spinachia spinachia]
MSLSLFQRRMLVRSLFLNVLLHHLRAAAAGVTQVPVQCLTSNDTGGTGEGFQVWVNSSGSKVNEGADVTLTCLHNLPKWNLTFGWKMNGKEIETARNKRQLCLKNVLSHDEGQYVCFVNSLCGYYESSEHGVTVENQSVLLLIICGVTALAMVLIIGMAMKYKLKRDAAKHRKRRQQRDLEQNGAPSFIHA